jgi:uncharacterized protein (TIGR00255 family)
MRSMTGYGRDVQIINGREILVELKSVNHRYYEFSARVPRAYGFLDEKLKAFIGTEVTRGKLEVYVGINSLTAKEMTVRVNADAAQSYISALREAGELLHLRDDITLTNLLHLQDVFKVQKVTEDEEEIWQDVKTVAQTALSKFVSSREREGKALCEDILARLETANALTSQIETQAPRLNEEYRVRLTEKLNVVFQDKAIDETRLLTECAIFAEKTAVDEETVRLKTHLQSFRELLEIPNNGRKLDFLMQELNREINTIGSKIGDINVTNIVIEVKSVLEKIREQIQNLE